MRSLSSPSVILWLGGVCAWQAVCISWSWWLLYFTVWRNTVIVVRVHSKIVRRFRNGKFIAMKHRSNCRWYILKNKCWFILHGHTILNMEHHTQITVNTVIARHPPNHWHSKRHTTSFPFTYQHTCGAHFFPCSPTLKPKYKKYAFFIVGVIEQFLEANVTSPQIQQTLSGLFTHFRDIFINILHNLWQQNASETITTRFSWKNLGTPSTIRLLSYNT